MDVPGERNRGPLSEPLSLDAADDGATEVPTLELPMSCEAGEKAVRMFKSSILPSRLLIRSNISVRVLSFLYSLSVEARKDQNPRGRDIRHRYHALGRLRFAIIALEAESLAGAAFWALLVAFLFSASACIAGLVQN